MPNKYKVFAFVLCFMSHSLVPIYAQNDGFGQVIKIQTHLRSFIGRPSWLVTVRDIDHNQNMPYVFEITRGDQFWLIPTLSRNYLITISNMQFSPYRRNPYGSKTTNNFCNLESRGRIIRNQSISVYLEGDLSPYTATYSCTVSKYADTNFPIATMPGAQ